jgi:hypothetical protein
MIDHDKFREYGPDYEPEPDSTNDEQEYLIKAIEEIPLVLPRLTSKPVISAAACKTIVEKYNIPPAEKYIFPFELEQMQERLKR